MNTTQEVLKLLSLAYPRQNVSKETAATYYIALRDIDPELLKAAALKLISESKWFPAISELRAAAGELLAQSSNVPMPYDAWNEVKKLRGEYSHPFVERAIMQLGGVSAFGKSEVSEEMSWRARFIDAYTQICEKAQSERVMLPEVVEYRERLAAVNHEVKRLSDSMGVGVVTSGREQETAVNDRRNELLEQAAGGVGRGIIGGVDR